MPIRRTKPGTARRYKDEKFLKALGDHCRKLRTKAGYSIDRVARESEKLSPSVIHRLENGSGAVNVMALRRYAEVLGLALRDLVDFQFEKAPDSKRSGWKILPPDSEEARELAYHSYLPLLSLKAAAGYFGPGSHVEPEGWIEFTPNEPGDTRLFVARAIGNSMEPQIANGDYLLFRFHPTGSRQGKIVLAEYRGPADPETGGSYTVKRYTSIKVTSKTGEWRHREIVLSPTNPQYEPISLRPQDEEDFRIIAELVAILKPGRKIGSSPD